MLKKLLGLLGMGGEKAAVYVMLHGDIYGGSYHFFAENTVRSRNIKGWMKTRVAGVSGYIEMDLEGDSLKLQSLLEELRQKSERVKFSRVQWKPYRNAYREFKTAL